MSKAVYPPCPYCQHEGAESLSGVKPTLRDDVLFRRQKCDKCRRTFTTAQVALTPELSEKLEATLD